MTKYGAALAVVVAAALGAPGCRSTPTTEQLRTHADEAFARGEYERAVKFDDEILRRAPEDYGATLQRGVASDRLGDQAQAAADYGRAVELKPDQGLPRLYRANLYIKSGQVESASDDVTTLLSSDLPKHERVAALVIAGTHARKRGELNTAVRYYRQGIETGRGEPDPFTARHYRDALYNAAECYYLLGTFDDAKRMYSQYVAEKEAVEEPVTEGDHYNLGVLNYLVGDFKRAKAHFARVSSERRKQAAELLNDQPFFAAMDAASRAR